MGKACTCCDTKICNCRRVMESLDFSFGDFNTTFEINKDIFDVNEQINIFNKNSVSKAKEIAKQT